MIGTQSFELGGTRAQVARFKRRIRLLYAGFDFNPLIFTKTVDPREVASAIFPITTLHGIVIENRIARDDPIDVVCAVVPETFLEEGGNGQCFFIAELDVHSGRQVITPTPRMALTQLLRNSWQIVGAVHFAFFLSANLTVPLKQGHWQGHGDGAHGFTEGII